MQEIKVKNNRLISFSRKSDLEKAEKVRKLIQEVINDKFFRNEILKAEFKDRRFIDENRKTIEIKLSFKKSFLEKNSIQVKKKILNGT